MYGIGCEVNVKIVTVIAILIENARCWPKVFVYSDDFTRRITERCVTIERVAVPNIIVPDRGIIEIV